MNKRVLKRTLISVVKTLATLLAYIAAFGSIVLASYGLAMALSKYTAITCSAVVVGFITAWVVDVYNYEARVDARNRQDNEYDL